MANHTKGEWVYKKGPTGIRRIYGASGEKKIIATVKGLEDGIDNVARRVEANANAQLMAASPDLLNVCIELFELLEHEAPEWYKRGHSNRATFAITKATLTTLQPN